MNYRILWVPVAVTLLTAGCATQHVSIARSLAETTSAQGVITTEKPVEQVPANFTSPSGTVPETTTIDKLTLSNTLGLALQHNPTLASFATEIRTRDAAALQAGLLPNPDLGVEMENFAGQDDRRGLDGAETTIAFSQLIELGGKRSKRRQVADLEKNLAEWDYQSKKLDVLASTANAFIRVLVAQDQVSLNDELVRLAEQTYVAVGERVAAGKVSPVEKARVQVELAATQTNADKARRELEVARRLLVSFWGTERIEFKEVFGDLTEITPLTTEEAMKNNLGNNPDLARWKRELERREASVALARSQAVPDVTFTLGVRNFQETDDTALVAGVEIPLPLFNRNQGGIGEALANLDKARQEQLAADIAVRSGLSETWQRLAAAYGEAVSLRDEILPGAKTVFEAVETGYREGKYDVLNVLDAQRTLFSVRRQYLEALENYHLARTDVERLIGAPLEGPPKSETEKNK